MAKRTALRLDDRGNPGWLNKGKTSFGPVWLLREVQRCGPGDYLAVTSTFPLLKLKMLPEFLRLWQHTLRLGTWRAVDRVFALDQERAADFFGNPAFRDTETRVIFGSASNSESLESATAKAAWLDEVGQDDFRLESWEAVQRRLSLNQGRVLGGTTLYNLGWLKQQVFDRWQGGDSDHAVIQFPSIVNPAFPEAEYERARRTLPAWKFSLFYKGQYERPAGLIYQDFTDELREQGGHKVRPFDLPPFWPRHAGIDFGAVNTALVWLAQDPEADVYYLYRATLEGGLTTPQHAALAQTEAHGTNMLTWHGGSKSETQQRMDWRAAGVPIQEPTISDVEAGIDRVIGLFKAFRLFVFDDCTGALDELGTYRRELDALGRPTEKIKDKQTFHRCFVAGTRIRTLGGDVPIARVRVGDWVLTRSGYRPVAAVGLSASAAPVMTLVCSDGRTLTGTAEHPVYVAGRGYIALRALRYGDILSLDWERSCRAAEWSARSSCTRASGSIGIPPRVTARPATTSRPVSSTAGAALIYSTARFGRTATAPSRRGMRFTTATTIRSTTRPIIWSASLGWITATTTPSTSPRSSAPSSESTGNALGWPPPIGTAPRLAGCGTEHLASFPGRTAGRWSTLASAAAPPLPHARRTACASALTAARAPRAAPRVWTMSPGCAWSVVRPFPSTASRPSSTAPVRVVAVLATGSAPVYNLTVADAHEYYANGVLVHNCDALRYVVQGITDGQDPGSEVIPSVPYRINTGSDY